MWPLFLWCSAVPKPSSYRQFETLKHIHTLREVRRFQESVAEEQNNMLLLNGQQDADIALKTSDL